MADCSPSLRRSLAAAVASAGLLLGLVIPAADGTPVSVTWSPPVALSEAGQDATQGRLALTPDGDRVTAVWVRHDGTNTRVQTSGSTDGGLTWSAPVDLSAAGRDADSPHVAVSRDGTRQFAVWRGQDGANRVVHASVSSDGGGTWSPVFTLSGGGGDAYNPRVVASGDGRRVAVVWRRFDAGRLRAQGTASLDGGATWTAPATLSAPGESVFDVRAAGSADGQHVVVVWRQSDGAHQRIVRSVSGDAGMTWSLPGYLSEAGREAASPTVASASGGTRVATAWSRGDGTDRRVQVSTSADSGLTWSLPQNVSEAGQDADAPDLAFSETGGRLVAVWQRSDGTNSRVQSATSSDGGPTWSVPSTLSDLGQDADTPRVTASAGGTRLSAAWTRSDGTHDRVESSSSADGGQTWSDPTVLSAAGQGADRLDTASTDDGTRTLALWRRSDGTNNRVEAATGSLSTVPGAPSGVAAKPKPRKAKVSWDPPGDDGNSPITQYTATAQPGGQGCVTTGTACTVAGLTNRTTYTVTVTATNALGPGPASTPVQVTPAPKAVAIAKPVAGRSKLKVRIKPNLGPRKQWKFTVKKRVSGAWKTLRTKRGAVKVYQTRGPKHIRVLNLKKGRYKARSRAARGYLSDYSTVVRLRR